MQNIQTLRGEHAFAFSIYVVNASYCGSVHFREYRVVWGRFGVVSLVLNEINVSDPNLQRPVATMSVCLRVGGLDVKIKGIQFGKKGSSTYENEVNLKTNPVKK